MNRVVFLAGLLATPSAADACGGFFCSSSPVDQTAERILFVQEDPQTVSAYVEIKFQGDPGDFAWIVPVPSLPEFAIWHDAFNALDAATQPVFNPPFQCFPPAFAEGGAVDEDGDPAPGRVDVLGREVVGDYDIATIESDDPRALVEWLRVNGYRITPEMEPFVDLYVAEGLKFTAAKLLPGEGLDSIKPLKMTYAATGPMVPLRLTSVAAQLEMGVKVWVLGDGRFGPGEGTRSVEVGDDEIVFDFNTFQTNYLTLVAKKVDEVGGRGFITEYAQPTAPLLEQIRNGGVPGNADEEVQASFDALLAVLAEKPYITRLYTRLSPEEMSFDPTFVPAAGGDVSNIHEIPPPEDQEACGGQPPEADPCAFTACGAGGRCVVAVDTLGRVEAGCACVDDAVARPQAALGQQPGAPTGITVACGDNRLNFTNIELQVDVDARPDLIFRDPCEVDPCGQSGECIALNGSQSCRCDRGFIAVGRMDDEGKPFATCVQPRDQVPDDFYRRTLPEPDLPYPGRKARRGGAAADEGCSATGAAAPAELALLLFALAPFARARRRD